LLRSLNEMKGYSLRALEGQIGRCRDFLLDDKSWVLRYMVADTGGWLSGREVLISPNSIGKPNWASHSIPVNLTKAQIENAPPLEKSEPVSRAYEVEYYRYFNWPYYWVGAGGGIGSGHPVFPPSELEDVTGLLPEDSAEKSSQIRSVKELIGYHIQAIDREIGHLEDFIVDEDVDFLKETGMILREEGFEVGMSNEGI